jgi:hypothetical protein
MSFPHDSLQALVGQTPGGEIDLIPLVRRVLRTGCGLPELVQWVRTTLPQVQSGQDRTRPVDPDRAAPPLARLLCATLRRGRLARPVLATDTVVGV